MSTWRIDALPDDFTVSHTLDRADGAWRESYTIACDGVVSDPLYVGSDSFQTDLDSFVNTNIPEPTAADVAAAWVQLRMIRDRWLAQTDYVESFINDETTFSHLPEPIQTAITANKTGWVAWRQGLRDLPATPGTPGLDPVDAVAAITSVHTTTDVFPAPWPQPPAAPVIHLT